MGRHGVREGHGQGGVHGVVGGVINGGRSAVIMEWGRGEHRGGCWDVPGVKGDHCVRTGRSRGEGGEITGEGWG